MKPVPTILTAVCVLALFAAQSPAQTTKLAKPTEMVAPADCTSAGCHAEVKDFKFLHGPLNVNACEACHRATDVKHHNFELTRTKADVCTFCHQPEAADLPVVHKPFTEGECLACHNPHGGVTPKFTRGESLDRLCNECHKSVTEGKQKIHGPVAAAACTSCHPPHAAKFPKLLIAEGRDLCFSCHAEMKSQMAMVKFKHEAVEQDCMTCHDAHASNFPMQTREPPLELCTSCHEHEPIKQAALSSANKHSIVTSGDACLNCHTAHGGDLAKLLRNDQLKVCMKCHSQPIKLDKGARTIAAVSEVLDSSLVKHGPIKEGSCGGCHNVHGSGLEAAHLLKKAYPAPFYQAFSLDKYDLCFSCHEKELVLMKQTAGLTNFRNGDRNLHYVHVNKERGRNCRACHDAHASANPLHVRSTVQYGNWQMPINFKQTQTGGSCAPGCHKDYAYDRDNPLTYDTRASGPQPTTASTGGVTEKGDRP